MGKKSKSSSRNWLFYRANISQNLSSKDVGIIHQSVDQCDLLHATYIRILRKPLPILKTNYQESI